METPEDDEVPTFYATKGCYIVNAVTGVQTGLKVGSKYERRFWKVSDVSLQSYDPSTGTGLTYFFPSPETYENQKNIKISAKAKRSWRKRLAGANCTCLSAHVCTL